MGHHSLNINNQNEFFLSLGLTVLLGFLFIDCQLFEYKHSNFNISDFSYGTSFYSLTGLHGLHVLIGTLSLFYCLIRSYITFLFNKNKYLGYFKDDISSFIYVSYYWHFVDIVWVLLFLIVYIF